ncbi:hypothetical protein I317_06043 [Kwoniella heveanensis CBS 569]|nr:hypothetical protein I317_06043 [Kwoniella heveanensis CBS 569]
MPRKQGQSNNSLNQSGPAAFFAEIKEGLGLDDKKESSGSGYEVEEVCLFCLGHLQVTAASLQQLRALPIKRLKDYLAAYNIPCIGPKEKEDFVQAVVRARNPATGCLSPEAESYFRRRSVPKQGQLSTASASSSSSSTPRPRPPPPSQARPSSQPYSRPPPPTQSYRPPPPPAQARPPPPRASPAPAPRPAATTPKPAPAPAPVRQPSPPVPTILSLVSLPKSYLASLSIGTLKAILYENHVRVDFKQVLEKDQLIDRVNELIVDERKRLERQRIEEERQANGDAQAHQPVANGVSENGTTGENGETDEAANVKVPTGPMPEIDRGLCVVCQDEEATLAVVDCG